MENNTMVLVIVGILLALSVVQAMELNSLRYELGKAKATYGGAQASAPSGSGQAQAPASAAGAPAPSAPSSYGAMVGGC